MRRLIQNCVLTLALSTSSVALAEDAPALDLDPRPTGNAIGIGAGWSFPQSILEPNTVSVRFRLGKIALEPSFLLGGDSQASGVNTTATMDGVPGSESKTDGALSGFDAGVGTQVRYPIASRGPLDLVAIGDLSFSWGSKTREDNGPADNQVQTTSNQSLGANLGYGLGIEWFLGHGLSLSADARNPLVGWTSSTVVTETNANFGGTAATTRNETRASGLDWGLAFRPTVRVLMHLYF